MSTRRTGGCARRAPRPAPGRGGGARAPARKIRCAGLVHFPADPQRPPRPAPTGPSRAAKNRERSPDDLRPSSPTPPLTALPRLDLSLCCMTPFVITLLLARGPFPPLHLPHDTDLIGRAPV